MTASLNGLDMSIIPASTTSSISRFGRSGLYSNAGAMTIDDWKSESMLINEENDANKDELIQISHRVSYIPNVTRWLPTDTITQFTHNQSTSHPFLIGSNSRSSPRCELFSLITYNRPSDENRMDEDNFDDEDLTQICKHDKKVLSSGVVACEFADETLAVVAGENGQIDFLNIIKDENELGVPEWKFSPERHHEMICGFSPQSQPRRGSSPSPIDLAQSGVSGMFGRKRVEPTCLTCLSVSTFGGSIAAGDEFGNIHSAQLAEPRSIANTKKCASSAIYDVCYTGSDGLACVTMAGQLLLYDLRSFQESPINNVSAPHKVRAMTCMDIHPHRSNVFVTGSEMGCVMLWDMRKLNSSVAGATIEPGMFQAHTTGKCVNKCKLMSGTRRTRTNFGLLTCGNDGGVHLFGMHNVNEESWTKLFECSVTDDQSYVFDVVERGIVNDRSCVNGMDWNEQLQCVLVGTDRQFAHFVSI